MMLCVWQTWFECQRAVAARAQGLPIDASEYHSNNCSSVSGVLWVPRHLLTHYKGLNQIHFNFLLVIWGVVDGYCVHGLPDYEHKSEYIKLCSIQELTKVQLFQVLIGKHTMRLWAFQESEEPSTDPKMKGGPICVEKNLLRWAAIDSKSEQSRGMVLSLIAKVAIKEHHKFPSGSF